MRIKDHRLTATDQTIPFIKSPNQSGEITPKYLIIHYTAGASAGSSVNWFKNPAAKASAHLVISREGLITQMVKFNLKAWHAGRSSWKGVSGLNSHSIGIELANWGELRGSKGAYKSRTGRLIPDIDVLEEAHKNTPSKVTPWETFKESQLQACIAASQAICDFYNIPENNILGHDDISPSRKRDPGPAFDMAYFKSKVFGREEDGDDGIFVVRSATGLNLRKGPGTQFEIIQNLANGTQVVQSLEQSGKWWMVTVLDASGTQQQTGWVHSNWLESV